MSDNIGIAENASDSPTALQTAGDANLGTILRSIGDAVLVTDARGCVTLLNPVAERLTGWSGRDARGQEAAVVFDIINEQTRQTVENPIDRVLREGIVVGLANHTILRRRGGGEVHIDDSAAPVRDDAGRLIAVVLVFRDIGERRIAEAALRAAEERLRLATEGANIGTWDLDLATGTLFWDERCRAAFDYPLDRPVDYDAFLSMLHPDDREPVDDAVRAAFVPGGPGVYRVEYRTIGYGDGAVRWARAEGRALFNDERTQAVRFVGTIQDISERKEFEEELREARTRLEAALLAGEIATWTFDIVHNRVVADANLARLFSVSPDDAAGGGLETYLTAIHPDDRARVSQIIGDAIAGGGKYQTEYRVVLPGGGVRWLAARGKVGRDAGGAAVTLPGVVLDITDRKVAVEALTLSEARFRLQADAMPQMVWATDKKGNHLYFNRRWYDYTGQTVEESLGFGFALALHPDDQERTLETWRRAWQDGDDYDIEYRFRRSDGVYRWFVGRAEPIRDPDGAVTLWAGTCTDIDDLKRTQERQRFLADLSERTRLLREPGAVIAETVRAAGEFLGLSRLLYAEINETADTIRVQSDWCGDRAEDSPALPSVEGRWTLAEWGRRIAPWGTTIADLRAGRTVVVENFAADERTRNDWAAAPAPLPVHGAVRIPRLRDGEWVAMIVAQSAPPRAWTRDEIDLLGTVAERLWLNLENLRLFRETQMRAEREALVNLVGAAIQSSPRDTNAILQAAVTALGQGLQADRCYYVVYDQANDRATSEIEWRRPGLDLPPMAGQTFQMSSYSVNRDPRYRTGQTQAVGDVETYLPGSAEALLALRIRSLLRVPLQVGNQMTALAVAMAGEAHHWTRGEIRVVETVASQLQSALDAARLLTAERERAEREHFLNEIGEAVRSSGEPEEMQAILVERLGRALRADRCYVTVIDAPRDTFTIVRDYRAAESLPALAGRYRLSEYVQDLEMVYPRRRTLVVPDASPETASVARAMKSLGLRSLVSVPLYDGAALVGSLVVSMTESVRDWTDDEVALIESVALQARSSIESARLRQRERNIATQLQDSLHPPAPPPVAGIRLAHFYRPALAEASVGGDFFDVFRVRDSCTALVVADLSGKGLAAAQQVATVRNMLRFAVYSQPHLGQAVAMLHQTLVDNDLLTGFATLFIGCYDASEGTLNYVNCGQEPGLVWRRAENRIDELAPTGPILGGFAGGEFYQACVPLSGGDVFALFTDGLTEIGPNRADLLEIEGVRALLASCCAGSVAEGAENYDPSAICDRLIAGIDAYARGGVPDDIALLIGVIQDSGGPNPCGPDR